MNDQAQQQIQQQNTQQMAAFGGAMPFSNVPQQQQNIADVVYGPNPEAGGARIEKTDGGKTAEAAPESQKAPENKPEKYIDIERKEQKQFYPQNQTQQQAVAPKVVQTGANPLKPQQPAPKFFGYMVSPQIANNHALVSSLKGKGEPGKSRTWIYMLLDRILKKQTYIKKHAV